MKFPIRVPESTHRRLTALSKDMDVSVEEAAATGVERFCELPVEERSALLRQHFLDEGGAAGCEGGWREITLDATLDGKLAKAKVEKWSKPQTGAAALAWLVKLPVGQQKDLLCQGTASKFARLVALVEQHDGQSDYLRLLRQLHVWLNKRLGFNKDMEAALNTFFSNYNETAASER